MVDYIALIQAMALGVLLGAFFFGGLWWTVYRKGTSKNSALWFLGSLVVRAGVVVMCFYFFAGDQWMKLLVCLIGFITARIIIVQSTRTLAQKNLKSRKMVNYES